MSAVDVLSQVFFNLGLVSALLITWVWARVALLLTWPCQQGCFRRWVNKATLTLLSVLWGLPFCLSCCFIKLRVEGVSEMRQAMAAKKGKPRVMLQNHTSFLDAVVATQFLGCCNVGDMKAMASEHLFKMPLLGPVCVACGHLSVPFKSQETQTQPQQVADAGEDGKRKGSVANFSVDKDAVKKVTEAFEEHVRSGGIGAWYPEGRLNPDPEAGLQQFRAGGFKLVVDVDCEVWCVATKNNERCWPRKAALGGLPTTIYGRCFKLCSSSHELLQSVPGDDRAKAIFLANKARTEMSEALDACGSKAGLFVPPKSPMHSRQGSRQPEFVAFLPAESEF